MATPQEHIDGKDIETDIAVTSETEYQKYAYNKPDDIWALVTLKAPCHELETQRAPIDVVAVIDKSGSMSGAKLNLVKQTLEFFITQLKSTDRLSVITYDTNVYVDFRLLTMTKENKSKCSQLVKNIRSGSSTNLSGGLMKGLSQIIHRDANKNEVASVLLFTDGLANAGITSAAGIVAAMSDPMRFDGPALPSPSKQPPKHQSWIQRATGSGTPIEHTDAAEEKKTQGPAPASVYAFGFGEDHDPDMLKAISDAGNGMYYFIEYEDQIPESFGHCLGGLLSTVGQGITMNITLEDGVKVKDVHVNRPFEIAANKKSVNVNMGDLQSEEERDIVLQLSIEAVPAPMEETPQPLFNAVANYFNVITSSLGSATTHLAVARTVSAENKPEESSIHVSKQKVRIETSGAIAQATELADRGQFEMAQACLRETKAATEANVFAEEDGYYEAVIDDLESCSNVVQDRHVWKKKGKKVNMNMLQMHEQQRSSEPAGASSERYVSKPKMLMARKFKGAVKK